LTAGFENGTDFLMDFSKADLKKLAFLIVVAEKNLTIKAGEFYCKEVWAALNQYFKCSVEKIRIKLF
jgi:hypothetical protein